MSDLPELPQQVGFITRDDDKLRFADRLYRGAEQHEVAGQKIWQALFTAEQIRAYALAERTAERERCAKLADGYAAQDWSGAEGARRTAAAIRSQP